ncbi:MAG: tannase/feruloyl esterase family alpha/beta hydrolase [Edaphobacter sp.]|uniref:tannase/feruloyl esterase family alpha/beta hydrolase n=1 Tax=Edaphobacter sp. TaxID=1934404 RepID=UPI002385A2A1|nr:tannase/feruloyl esterase family alpha/beta hydrolase [Edaphobacter sp.]MDE1175042.1 tannase/feruloyl esterase family alpha/beta hydrolase [Edaphobacter sp.]
MRKRIVRDLLLLAVLTLPGSGIAVAEDCARLKTMSGVTSAEVVHGGSFTPQGGKAIDDLPEFCRVTATLNPSGDSSIKIEVWLPVTTWNQRLEGTGNGGLAGHIGYGPLADGLKDGYAVANTDMGLGVPDGKDAGIYVGHPERWADWGWRSTHEMTVFAKSVVKMFYGRAEKKDYFVGCSTGGEQALMEAQRFPDDYDGIVGGAPAHNRTGVHESILWNFAALEAPGSSLSADKLTLVNQAVVKACDMNDGVKDGLIGDPRSCRFDPAVLLCKDGKSEQCLTPSQVEAVNKTYAGPKDSRNGRQLYPGLERGSEFAWGWLPSRFSIAKAPFAPVFEWVFGADWAWQSFDYGNDVDTMQAKLSGTLNATDPNLDLFMKHGHKLVLYHGWADQIVPPGETITYFNAAAARAPIDGSVRLFMLPGVQHCSGGQGPSTIAPLDAVVNWVEKGKAPEALTATGNGMVRIVCAYPAEPKYNGQGDINNPTSYVCSMKK